MFAFGGARSSVRDSPFHYVPGAVLPLEFRAQVFELAVCRRMLFHC